MNFSVAKLIKQSACQVLYLSKHKDKVIVTPEQLSGIKKQAKVSESPYVEMCGNIADNENTFYFSWDEVKEKSGGVLHFIEHKATLGESADWYLEKSLLQTAIYAALTVKLRRGPLKTAKFFVALGNKERTIDMRGASRRFYLNFGGKIYKIRLIDSEKLIKYVFKKGKVISSKSFDTCKEFDQKWKFNEYKKLKDCFEYNECK